MIDLNIQDEMDGKRKVAELRAAVGKTYGYKQWATKLISVAPDGVTCIVEEQGKRKTQPSWITWNRFFF